MSKLNDILKRRKISKTELEEISRKICKTPLLRYKISNIANGKCKNYSVTTLIKLCRILEVTPNEILTKADYDHLFNS